MKKKTIYGFRVVSVFDISQTEGKEIPNDSVCEALVGSSEQSNFLVEVLTNKVIDISITYEEMGMAKGYFSPNENRIALNINNSSNHNAKTLMHECGHYWIRKKEIDINNLFGDTKDYKGLKEVEEVIVESVAYIVGQYFGLDSSEYSFGYVAGWSNGDVEQIKKAGSLIQRLSSEMIDAIEKEGKKATKVPA